MANRVDWKLPGFGLYRLLYSMLGPLKPERPVPETLQIERLAKPVTIHWNAQAVPSVKADTLHDAIRVQGYLHARFRAFQMDFLRRMPAGELAELLGPGALPNDLFMRRLSLKHWASQSIEAISAEARQVLSAYADGVNQAIEREPLASEYRFLKTQFRPWTPEDSVILTYALAWPLNGIWTRKWAQDRFASNPTMRTWLIDAIRGTPDITIVPGTGKPKNWGLGSDGIGSNNWVVNGAHTESGLPLLANDPHLMPLLPSIWYQLALNGGPLDVSGASLPGTPGVIIGQNRRIAWGVTNVDPDCQDLYRIRMAGDTHYLLDEKPASLTIREETIRVRGSQEVRLIMEDSHAGPVIHRERDGSRIALRWTGFAPLKNVDSILAVNLANDWSQFVAALEDWWVPAQNFVYADADGHIGYVLAGKIPTHDAGPHFGCADGNTAESLPTGSIAWEDMPRILDPESGWIVTANNAPVGGDYRVPVFSRDSLGYRAERIRQLLILTPRHTVATFQAIQLDDWSQPLVDLAQRLLVEENLPAQWRPVLEAFDGHARVDSAAPTLLYLWALEAVPSSVRELLDQPLFFDVEPGMPGTHPFPENFWELLGERLIPLIVARYDNLDRRHAFINADRRGRATFGENPSRWTWGKAHQVVLFHPFIQSRAAKPVYGREGIPTPGDFYTPRQAAFPLDPKLPWPRTILFLPSYRQVLTPGRPGQGQFVHLTGQSGHPLSPHYDDLVTPHLAGQWFPLGEAVRTTLARSTP